MLETFALIFCGILFIAFLVCLKILAMSLANEHPHKCKKCGGIMNIIDFHIYPESHGTHGIVWYECSKCGHKEEYNY